MLLARSTDIDELPRRAAMSSQPPSNSAEARLLGLQRLGVKLGLEQVAELFEMCGDPQKELKFIHVAGTNGKGSVCAIIAKALESAGLRTGFYSSPHLVSIRERFRVDSAGIPANDLNRLINQIWPSVEVMKGKGRCPTFFEVVTVIAAVWFLEKKCDAVVWETGMGGRFDATNVVSPIVSIITGIGFDHQQHLGSTIENIAMEKAGIIKPHVPAILGTMCESARSVIHAIAKKLESRVIEPRQFVHLESLNDPLDEVRIFRHSSGEYGFRLLGEHQWGNLSLSVNALDYLAPLLGFSIDAALRGIENVQWPGRFQLLPDGNILDGAHNPQGVDSLINSLRHYFPSQKFTFIFACLEDKKPIEELQAIATLALKIIFTPMKNPPRKANSPEDLLKMAKNVLPGVEVEAAENLSAAIETARASKNIGVITGSLFLAGEALMLYYKPEDIINLNMLKQ